MKANQPLPKALVVFLIFTFCFLLSKLLILVFPNPHIGKEIFELKAYLAGGAFGFVFSFAYLVHRG